MTHLPSFSGIKTAHQRISADFPFVCWAFVKR